MNSWHSTHEIVVICKFCKKKVDFFLKLSLPTTVKNFKVSRNSQSSRNYKICQKTYEYNGLNKKTKEFICDHFRIKTFSSNIFVSEARQIMLYISISIT